MLWGMRIRPTGGQWLVLVPILIVLREYIYEARHSLAIAMWVLAAATYVMLLRQRMTARSIEAQLRIGATIPVTTATVVAVGGATWAVYELLQGPPFIAMGVVIPVLILAPAAVDIERWYIGNAGIVTILGFIPWGNLSSWYLGPSSRTSADWDLRIACPKFQLTTRVPADQIASIAAVFEARLGPSSAALADSPAGA